MQKRSLGQTLARQWMGFAIALSLLFSGMSLLTLYMLEDHFLDRKLRSVALSIDTATPAPTLPAGFSVYPDRALPDELQQRFAGRSDGAHSEFRLANGRYVHALRARSRSGDSFLLVYDVTNEMTVNRALNEFWPFALLLAALFALLARLLAHGFMMRWSASATRLIEEVRSSESPAALSRYADAEPVQEFAELAQHSAEAWQNKLEALAREQEMLAFLNHELRTPLQSARTTLDLLSTSLPATTTGTDSWSRLARAIKRLERVSRSIRWLAIASDQVIEPASTTALAPLLNELLIELQPLARRKGVSVQLQSLLPPLPPSAAGLNTSEPSWRVPAEVAETLLANLLLNALQHGDNSDIVLTLDAHGVTISNGVIADVTRANDAETTPALDLASGSGLGLEIVRRWAARFGLQLACGYDGKRHSVRVFMPDGT